MTVRTFIGCRIDILFSPPCECDLDVRELQTLRRSRGAAGFLSGALDGASISSALHHLLANAAALGPAKCHLQPTSLPSL